MITVILGIDYVSAGSVSMQSRSPREHAALVRQYSKCLHVMLAQSNEV